MYVSLRACMYLWSQAMLMLGQCSTLIYTPTSTVLFATLPKSWELTLALKSTILSPRGAEVTGAHHWALGRLEFYKALNIAFH